MEHPTRLNRREERIWTVEVSCWDQGYLDSIGVDKSNPHDGNIGLVVPRTDALEALRQPRNDITRLRDCNLFDSSQAHHAINLGTGPRVEYDRPETLSAQVDSVFQSNGDLVAIKDQHGEVTYSQLAQRVDDIAASTFDLELPRESRIAVLFQPSAGLIAYMLAILRTGNIYVPLDLSLPQARHAAILENCRPSAMFCDQETIKRVSTLSHARVRIVNISQTQDQQQALCFPRFKRK